MRFLLAVIGPDGRFVLGAGDDTALGWSLFAGYGLAAALAIAARRRSREGAASEARLATLWLVVAVATSVLGANKQLDLQVLVNQIGKDVSRAQGWYEHRGIVQVAFATAFVLATAAGVAALLWHLRGLRRPAWPALAGLGLVLAYAALRAAAMEKVPQLHGKSPRLWLVEAAGLAVLVLAEARYLLAPRR